MTRRKGQISRRRFLGRTADAAAEAGSVDRLLKAAVADGWQRIQATDACLLLAENLVASGKRDEAVRIYTHLKDARTDPSERYVRDAAEKALAAVK